MPKKTNSKGASNSKTSFSSKNCPECGGPMEKTKNGDAWVCDNCGHRMEA